MKTYGFTLTEEQINAGLRAMKGSFRAYNVELALIRAGVPNGATSIRSADKLLQRERKAGRIKSNHKNKREWLGGQS